MIKQEIGRGSFGAVHLAIDQFGNEYVCFFDTRHSSLANWIRNTRRLRSFLSPDLGNALNRICYGDLESPDVQELASILLYIVIPLEMKSNKWGILLT